MGPRDGLQNEPGAIPTSTKVEFIDRLSATGLPVIESTSFVSPKWVPQLADCSEVMQQIQRRAGVRYTCLTPNLKVRSSYLQQLAGWTDWQLRAVTSTAASGCRPCKGHTRL